MLMSCTTVLVRLQPSGKGVTVPNRHPEGPKAGWAPMWIGSGIRLDPNGIGLGFGRGAVGTWATWTGLLLNDDVSVSVSRNVLVISCPSQ